MALLLAFQAQGQIRRAAEPDSSRYDVRDHMDDQRPANPAAALSSGAAAAAPAGQPLPTYSLTGPLTTPEPGDPEDIARRFLAAREFQHQRAFSPTSADQRELSLASRSRSPRFGLTHLTFQQIYRGIPVFEGDLQVHLDDQGRIWRFSEATPFPENSSPAEPKTTARRALEAALEMVLPGQGPIFEVIETPAGTQRRTVFASQALSSPAPVSLVWFIAGHEALVAWQMYLDLSDAGAYWVVVDSRDGRILFSRSLVHQERPAGLVFQAPDHASPLDGPQTNEPWAGWPASHGDCPADVYPQQFRSGSQRQRCWVSGQQTVGNNADTCLDLNGNNLCDGRASATQDHFAFPFSDSFDRVNDPAPDREAALANAFYWANALHDWLYRLGFDEAAGNFQADNFGRGGAAGDALRIDLQDPAALNNATFTGPPDGIAPRVEMGLFTGLRRDSAFDADILAHEYVHGLTIRLVGGPANASGLSLWQSGALGEGWSDAYAASLTGDAVIGEYATRNPATGIRTVAYDNSPYTFGMFGTLRPTVIPNSGGLLLGLPQVHRDGEIWATVLWDLRQALGRDDFEQVLTTALKLTPPRPSMLDARDAILQAALAGGIGGGNNCGVWGVFAARGFGYSAAWNPVQAGQANDTALSVFESFDLPEVCGSVTPLLGSVLLEADGESEVTTWTAAGQWHRTSRRSAAGNFSWWYGQEATGTYETGGRNRGTLTSAALDLGDTAGAVLEWDQFLRSEGFHHAMDVGGAFGPYLNADSGRVMVSSDGGSSWRVLTHIAHPTPGNAFVRYRVNLSRFAGQVIRLRFDFDTFDSRDNLHEGWFVDNIRVTRLGPEPARLLVDPPSLSLSHAAGGGLAPPQTVTVSTHGGDAAGGLVWKAAVAKGSSWLSVLPASGTTPAAMQVSANPLGLAPGVHYGEILLYEFNEPQPAAALDVTLSVEGPPGPLAKWAFEEEGRGSGISLSDGSSGGHAAVTVGAGTQAVDGVSGRARLFDGVTGFAEVAASTDFAKSSLTFRAWVKLADYPSPLGVIASALDGGTQQGWFVGVLETGNLALMALGPANEPVWLVSSRAIVPGKWHAVAVTLDQPERTAVLYLDGELAAASPFVGLDPGISSPLTIGRASWWDGYFLAFAIDEMRLDSAVWSPGEVEADLASFSPPAEDAQVEPVAAWDFEEIVPGAESVVSDTSGNGRDMILPGGGSQAVVGIDGNALAFDGISAYGRIAPHADFGSASFSFSTWIKLDAYPSDWGVVFSTFNGGHGGWFSGVNNDGRVILSVWGQPSFSTWVLSERPLQAGQWHHVAVVFDELSQRAQIHIDGQADRSFRVGGFTPQTSAELTFARASWFDGYYLRCVLDKARLFGVPLPTYLIRGEFASRPSAP